MTLTVHFLDKEGDAAMIDFEVTEEMVKHMKNNTLVYPNAWDKLLQYIVT